MKRAGAAGAVALFLALVATPAPAHVTVQPSEAPVGAFFKFVVRVPNERDDAATTRVTVTFPDNLIFVSFQDVPGWERRVQMRTLDEPIEAFGASIDEVVGRVTWSGGRIEPGTFAEFPFSARVPEDETVLEFPAVQVYSSGEVVKWTGPPDSEEPAALVSTVDIGAEEGQGQLAVVAELRAQVEGLQADLQAANDHMAEMMAASGDDDDGFGTATALGAAGLGLGALALVVALLGRRRPG
jgi:uncharacterized protein YcnI